MEPDTYPLMASHEAFHWWFVGRRAVIAGLLECLALPPSARVLEAGCGTGGNLYSLQRLGEVSAFEPHPAAIEIARSRHPDIGVEVGELPDCLPFPKDAFDLVAALDVLEHVDEDRAALGALVRFARPGGYVIVTVPTHPYLFGRHDLRLHHKRRYGVAQFRELCTLEGCELVYFGAFNTLLAPIAFTVRIAEKLLSLDLGNQERVPPGPINRLLAAIFALEGRLVPRVRLPYGLSHAAIIRRLS